MAKTLECGGNVTNSYGTISYPSENHTVQYDSNVNCSWFILADDSYRIEIEIFYLDDECNGIVHVSNWPSLVNGP